MQQLEKGLNGKASMGILGMGILGSRLLYFSFVSGKLKSTLLSK